MSTFIKFNKGGNMYLGEFVSLDHFGTHTKVKTCYMKREFPPYFYDMGCGTFPQFIKAPSTILTLDINGNYVPFQVYKILKEVSNNHPFTPSFINELNKKMDGQEFNITHSFVILDLRKIFMEKLCGLTYFC